MKRSRNLSQRSQKVLWNQNFTCSLVWSCVLMHNGQAKKTNPTPKRKRTKYVCTHTATLVEPGHLSPLVAWRLKLAKAPQQSQASKFSPVSIHTQGFTTDSRRGYQISQHLSDLRLFSMQQPSVPRQPEKVSSQDKATYVGLEAVPSTLLLTPALIYSHHEPFNGAHTGKPNLQKKIPPSSWVSWVCSWFS